MIVGRPESVSPHSRRYYFTVSLLGPVAALAFFWGTFFAPQSPIPLRLAQFGIALVLLLGGIQAFERLRWPENARARSHSLPPFTRLVLGSVRKRVGEVCLAGFVASGLMRLFGGAQIRDLAADLGIVAAVLFFAGACLADLCGER
jgi:hypothetical protein